MFPGPTWAVTSDLVTSPTTPPLGPPQFSASWFCLNLFFAFLSLSNLPCQVHPAARGHLGPSSKSLGPDPPQSYWAEGDSLPDPPAHLPVIASGPASDCEGQGLSWSPSCVQHGLTSQGHPSPGQLALHCPRGLCWRQPGPGMVAEWQSGCVSPVITPPDKSIFRWLVGCRGR